MRRWVIAFAIAASSLAPAVHAATATRSTFGQTADGHDVAAVTLANGRGMSVRVIAQGASLQSVILPDRAGKPADVLLGYDTMAGYDSKPSFFGATVGRVANRIAGGRYTLDGQEYTVPIKGGKNALHGGTRGFDKVLWTVVDTTSGPTASVTLRYVSPDGDMGFPGTLTTTATYSLDENDQLTLEYRATTDKPTVVNISNHSYWNLAGPGSTDGAMGHVLTIPADRYTPTDAGGIPTGQLAPVAGTPFDFRMPHAVGERAHDVADPQIRLRHGYDHNWVFGTAPTAQPHLIARVADPASGRGFELWSNQPGVQFYSGNLLNGTIHGKSGKVYARGDAIVLEPQMFPDAPNQPAFPSIRLATGAIYRNIIIYRFTTGQKH